VPVLARQASRAALRRIRSCNVPVRPATGSESSKGTASSLSSIAVSSDTTACGDVRFERDSPEPSATVVRIPISAAVWRTTAAPALVVPPAPKPAPSALISVSAMKLSDGTFIEATRFSMPGELSPASGTAAAGATPARAARRTVTPRRRSAAVKALAAKAGGLAWNSGRRRPVKPRLNVSALSGPT
jgi:hypothetical protein